MIKNISLLILNLLFVQLLWGQKNVDLKEKDTLNFYINTLNQVVKKKGDASYGVAILPIDTVTRLSISNNIIFQVGYSSSRDCLHLSFEGIFMTFYPNSHFQSRFHVKNNMPYGNMINYYPDGKIYNIVNVDNIKNPKYVECRDIYGAVLANNGYGRWVIYDKDFKNEVFKGIIKDSVKVGEWSGIDSGKTVYINTYENGTFVSGVYYDKSGGKHTYNKEEVEPSFGDGPGTFNDYLAQTVQYPNYDIAHKISGKVKVTFVVEKDGTVTNVKVLSAPDGFLAVAVVQAVQSSPLWNPGMRNGQALRVQYTISFDFKLKNTL
jgi:TonB family protein